MNREDLAKIVGMYIELLAEKLLKKNKKELAMDYLKLWQTTVDVSDPKQVKLMLSELLEHEQSKPKPAQVEEMPELDLSSIYTEMKLSNSESIEDVEEDLARISLACSTPKWGRMDVGSSSVSFKAVSEDTLNMCEYIVERIAGESFGVQLPLVRPKADGTLVLSWTNSSNAIELIVKDYEVKYIRTSSNKVVERPIKTQHGVIPDSTYRGLEAAIKMAMYGGVH